MLCSTSVLFGAPFVDNLNNTDNLAPFGGLSLSLGDNMGDSFVTMTRISAGDEGAAWTMGGVSLSLDPADEQYQLNITPIVQPGNDNWQVNIVFFNEGGAEIGGQPVLISFAESSSSPTSDNIATFAMDNMIENAASYRVLFRVGNEYSFTEIAAVPEPGHFALLIGGASVAFLAYRRKRAK